MKRHHVLKSVHPSPLSAHRVSEGLGAWGRDSLLCHTAAPSPITQPRFFHQQKTGFVLCLSAKIVITSIEI
jgi:uracil DNA glycosylase